MAVGFGPLAPVRRWRCPPDSACRMNTIKVVARKGRGDSRISRLGPSGRRFKSCRLDKPEARFRCGFPLLVRRTYASMRYACGDDPVYVAEQGGWLDPSFPIRVYAKAARRRERLPGAHLDVRCGPRLGSNGQRSGNDRLKRSVGVDKRARKRLARAEISDSAPVAQRTERRPSKPWVAGSNPAGGVRRRSTGPTKCRGGAQGQQMPSASEGTVV